MVLSIRNALFIILYFIPGITFAVDQSELERLKSFDENSIDNETTIKALSLNLRNPLTTFALKPNGKAKKKFKISFQALVDYYNYTAPNIISLNPTPPQLLDLDLKSIKDKNIYEVPFFVDMNRKVAFPLELIGPHSISQLFVVNPKKYTQQFIADDFLTAKKNSYAKTLFNEDNLRYDKNLIVLDDWRSLNHPPVYDLGTDLTIWDKSYVAIDYNSHKSGFYSEIFQQSIDELSKSELSFGNKIEFLANGDSFKKKVEIVKSAKSSILISVMAFFCDPTSKILEDALVEKVREGIDVKLMVELVWTKLAMKKCMNRMIKSGVDVVYSSDYYKSGFQDNLFHNKFMIIDKKKVLTGGSNIVEGDNKSTGYNHLNRDNDVYVEGPIATDILLTFTKLWKKFQTHKNHANVRKDPIIRPIEEYETFALHSLLTERAKGKRGSHRYSQILKDPVLRHSGVCRFVAQGPDSDKHLLSKVFMKYIENAKDNLNMTTGSIMFSLPNDSQGEKKRLTWNKKFFETVFATSDRGVKLSLIGNGIDGGYGEISNMINHLNQKNRFQFKPFSKTLYSVLTSSLDKMAAKKNQPYMEFIQSKVNTRAWQNFQYMHAKLIQIDRTVGIVSSYNLEEWSSDKSYESAVICTDSNLNREMDKSFIKDFVNSVPAYGQSKDGH